MEFIGSLLYELMFVIKFINNFNIIQMATSQPLKFKVKEFQWFEMETKVRQIIQEVLGPMQKRMLQTANIAHKLKINQAEDQDKINQITLMIANDPKVFQTGIFMTVDHKFQEQSKHIEQLSRQIQQSNKYVDQKFKILDIRMQESSEVLKNVASLRERISKQIQLQNDNINHLRTNIETMIGSLNIDLRQTRKVMQINLEKSQKEQYAINEKIRTIRADIENINAVLDNMRDMHHEKSLRLQEHEQRLKRQGEGIDDLQESKNLCKKLQQIVKHMDNQLSKAQFKIDNVCPLITQAQISDCLYFVLPSKMRTRISVHQYRKYFSLNRQVLEKEYKSIHERFQGMALLQAMQKRNTREIVQLKRKKLMALGVDIDHMTYEQRQRAYNEVNLEDGLGDDDDQVKITNKIDQKQIIQTLQKFFNQFTSEVREKVKIQMEDAKKYMYGLEDELKHELSTYETRFTGMRKECETYHTSQLLENKSIEEELSQLNIKLIDARNETGYLKDLQRLFYNFCSLVNHLQIQDEIDKQNISLMGVQEQNNDPSQSQIRQKNSILELDKKCFSCCGYPASTLSAFKMACLTYNPSTIRIDTKEYKRQELLEFTTNMLHNIKKGIQSQSDQTQNQTQNQTINREENKFVLTQYQSLGKPSIDTHQDFSKNRLDSEPNPNEVNKKTASSSNKFRTTKKYTTNSIAQGSNSLQKSLASTNIKGKSMKPGLNQDLLNVSAAFVQLRRKNQTFLNGSP